MGSPYLSMIHYLRNDEKKKRKGRFEFQKMLSVYCDLVFFLILLFSICAKKKKKVAMD